MNACPKCNTPRAGAAPECATCGIIFARWELLERRRTSSSSVPSQHEIHRPPPVASAARGGSQTVLYIIAIVIFLIAGFSWTAYRRANRENAEKELSEKLDKINNEGREARARYHGRQTAAQQRAVTPGQRKEAKPVDPSTITPVR